MSNFKEETLEFMEQIGKSVDSILFIGSAEFKIPEENFWEIADFGYESGFGAQEIAKDLVVVFKDGSWMYLLRL